ncbi:protein of unknown function [Methylorubrum extorquens DM4]|uniref:Uncharacterized protein n=1 Tax=Methylorubrum extorquens (strain DSM 6343 / CIP 106787 / DM4) TaxID=661410 RepID=C7C977_METED|nr:protein of unknown function [Methylorubrum extorquens DM4]
MRDATVHPSTSAPHRRLRHWSVPQAYGIETPSHALQSERAYAWQPLHGSWHGHTLRGHAPRSSQRTCS